MINVGGDEGRSLGVTAIELFYLNVIWKIFGSTSVCD
jgi:hypothetical protein